VVHRREDRERRGEVLQTEHGEEGSECGQDQHGSVEPMMLLDTLQRRSVETKTFWERRLGPATGWRRVRFDLLYI
jgi:hypothetical protein